VPLVVFIYGPILIAALSRPTDVKVEGSTTSLDTMLFAGAILALASAMPRTDSNPACQPVTNPGPRQFCSEADA
jgi:hypothetical protein